ncbi:MAG TPA: hypothetical protein VHZ95_14610 [Polyangiales bacterium]|nr:hypothetical protein [Polyangiales bacterium]
MSASVLYIASRAVLVSEGGTPDAEYALFDAGEIELRSTGIGEVREAGYRTTVSDALARLEALGITESLIRDAGDAANALANKGYARGRPTHRLLGLLDGGELFDGYHYDAASRVYLGLWFDLRALSRDLGITGASAALQAMALFTLLRRVHTDETVVLDTHEVMLARRAGERSLRRVSLRHIDTLPSAMRSLAGRAPVSDGERGARSPEEILRILTERGEAERRIEQVREILNAPEPPTRGPLADPEAWAIERSLSDGATQGVIGRIEKLEQSTGRQPATIYLRARLALIRNSEAPRPIAERLSELVMSHSFCELELLAAQAWHAAGEPARARPFLRSLTSNPSAPHQLRKAADELVESTPMQTQPPPAMIAPASVPAETVRKSTLESARMDPSPVPPRVLTPPALELDLEMPPFPPPATKKNSAPPTSKAAPMPSPTLPPDTAPPKTVPATTLPTSSSSSSPNVPRSMSPKSKRYYSSDGYFSAIDLEWEAIVPPSRPPPSLARGAATLKFYGPTKAQSQALEASSSGSLSMPPASLTPRAMSARALRAAAPAELAEMLTLPPGGDRVDQDGSLLRTGLEARVHFTRLARELGRSYRERFSIELWSDIRGIETMQNKLREMFRDGPPKTPADVAEARRHGALFSEILTRSLGAEWSDISPTELGYWAMTIPPSTRVLPFGKMARFIAAASDPKSDAGDLMKYYLEIERRRGVV